MNKRAIIYYISAALINLIIVTALVLTLSWPFIAEVPIAISLYLQLLAASKYIFVNIIDRRGFAFSNIFTFQVPMQNKSVSQAD